MNIDLRCRNLYWELDESARIFSDSGKMNLSGINGGVEELISGGEACQTLLNSRRKLKDEQFYDLLLKFTYINDWNDYDCLHVLELAYNLKFDDFGTMKTTMHARIRKTEGHGKDFSYWEELVGIDFKVLYVNGFKIDSKHVYTTDEIKKLIEEKKIVIICEEERNLAWYSDVYKEEAYQRIAYAYDEYSMEHDFFDKEGKYYPFTLKYIRSNTKRKELLKLFKEHLHNANLETRDVTDKNHWNIESYKKVAQKYNTEFKKKGYAKRLEKLNEFNLNK